MRACSPLCYSVQVEKLASEVQGGGATLEEVGQQAESYRADLEARGRELARVKGEKEELERKVRRKDG